MVIPARRIEQTWPMPVPSERAARRRVRPAAVLRAELSRLDAHLAAYLAERDRPDKDLGQPRDRIDGYRNALLWLLGERKVAPLTGRVMPGTDPICYDSELLAGWDVYENPSWTPAGMTWVEATSVHYALEWARDSAGADSREPPTDTLV